jgi:alanine transaminase
MIGTVRAIRRGLWTLQNSNPKAIKAEYAVRGTVPLKAAEIEEKLVKKGHGYPFEELAYCNIGNPQQVGQKPLKYVREILACAVDPSLIERGVYHPDVSRRAKQYIDEMGSVGAYTASLGVSLIRKNVAKFIASTYGVPAPEIKNIFLTEGASQGVYLAFMGLIRDEKDSIMVPYPQYPLYSGAIDLLGGHLQEYYMDEDRGWSVTRQHLEQQVAAAKQQGKNLRAIILINPGNPTGSILSHESIKDILELAHQNGMVVLADEVYRENVYTGREFLSARKVLQGLTGPIRNELELITLNSVSKGILGECGLRGGYMEVLNLNPAVRDLLEKLKSMQLCSNAVGQIAVDLLVNPPTAQNSAPEVFKQYDE